MRQENACENDFGMDACWPQCVPAEALNINRQAARAALCALYAASSAAERSCVSSKELRTAAGLTLAKAVADGRLVAALKSVNGSLKANNVTGLEDLKNVQLPGQAKLTAALPHDKVPSTPTNEAFNKFRGGA